LEVFEGLGLVSEGSWAKESEFLLWRTSPRNWSLDFQSDERFQAAVKNAVGYLPEDIATKIADLLVIEEEQLDELIMRHAEQIEEGRQKYGPKARLGSVPSREQAQKSLEFSRKNALDWLFFRRWRIDDGWLSETAAKAALDVFHDRLAISMRKSVLQQVHPDKPQFFQ
jgi:pellino protein